ncbi:MAG TPA: hypothetical protein VK673_05395 [Chthoniobacterales bacterium]|nr:hypothetical protein [Chthoniobacterales bacterium]
MSEPENTTPATDAVKALHFFLRGTESPAEITQERLTQELMEAGIDLSKMATEVRKRIFQAQNRARLAGVQKTVRVNSPLISAGKALSDLRRAVEDTIQRLAMNEPQAAAVFYRKLEQSAPEDLESLLADLKELESDSKTDETQNHG